jgi:hypothetical protein
VAEAQAKEDLMPSPTRDRRGYYTALIVNSMSVSQILFAVTAGPILEHAGGSIGSLFSITGGISAAVILTAAVGDLLFGIIQTPQSHSNK